MSDLPPAAPADAAVGTHEGDVPPSTSLETTALLAPSPQLHGDGPPTQQPAQLPTPPPPGPPPGMQHDAPHLTDPPSLPPHLAAAAAVGMTLDDLPEPMASPRQQEFDLPRPHTPTKPYPEPSTSTYGCSKCRYSPKGCQQCRAAAQKSEKEAAAEESAAAAAAEPTQKERTREEERRAKQAAERKKQKEAAREREREKIVPVASESPRSSGQPRPSSPFLGKDNKKYKPCGRLNHKPDCYCHVGGMPPPHNRVGTPTGTPKVVMPSPSRPSHRHPRPLLPQATSRSPRLSHPRQPGAVLGASPTDSDSWKAGPRTSTAMCGCRGKGM